LVEDVCSGRQGGRWICALVEMEAEAEARLELNGGGSPVLLFTAAAQILFFWRQRRLDGSTTSSFPAYSSFSSSPLLLRLLLLLVSPPLGGGSQLPRPMREGMRIGHWKRFFFERDFSLSFLHIAFCSMRTQIIAEIV
jgi:hypothetical protein